MWTRIQRWGNSLGLRIPKALTQELGLGAGTTVDITVERGRIVLRPVDEQRYSLDHLIEQITPANQHPGVETGPPVGRETW